MRPTRRLLSLLAGWTLVALLATASPLVLRIWIACGVLLLVSLVIDCVWVLRTSLPGIERQLPAAMAVGHWHIVSLQLTNPSRLTRRFVLFDGYPPGELQQEGLPVRVTLPPRARVALRYRVRALVRGEALFAPTELLLESPLGLLARRRWAGLGSRTRVFPDFRQVAKLSMLAVEQRIAQLGVHLQRRRGEGTEFFQLREYREGDSQRKIDWKASSRRGALVSREYREEQDQRVMLLLDCGRRMHARDGELSHFDHVLNASLLLAHVALQQGDAVGMVSFSGQDRYAPPVKGVGSIHTLVSQLFDLQTTAAPSDYVEAVSRLMRRQQRRSLVVLLTNLRDDDCSDLPRLLEPLRRQHLVLVASMREVALDQLADQTVADFESALAVGAATHHLAQRKEAHRDLRRTGILLVDETPERLPAAIVNTYLEIKRGGLL